MGCTLVVWAWRDDFGTSSKRRKHGIKAPERIVGPHPLMAGQSSRGLTHPRNSRLGHDRGEPTPALFC